MKTHSLIAIVAAALCALSRLSNAATAVAGADLLANEKPDDAGDSVNPNPTVPAWSYGYRADLAGTALTPFTASEHSDSFIDANDPIEGFYVPGGASVTAVMVNAGIDPYTTNFGAGPIGPSEMFTHGGPPGPNAFAVVRYKSGDTEGHVVINGISMSGSVLSAGGSAASFFQGVSLAAGDFIDFVIGTGTASEVIRALSMPTSAKSRSRQR